MITFDEAFLNVVEEFRQDNFDSKLAREWAMLQCILDLRKQNGMLQARLNEEGSPAPAEMDSV